LNFVTIFYSPQPAFDPEPAVSKFVKSTVQDLRLKS